MVRLIIQKRSVYVRAYYVIIIQLLTPPICLLKANNHLKIIYNHKN